MRSIKLFLSFQILLLSTFLFGKEFFINFELAFLTSMLIMQGSMYSYSRLVSQRVEEGQYKDEDALKKIDDPYDLYDDESEEVLDDENFDLKEYIKEEKKRIKSKSTIKNTISTSPAMVSLFRIVPYIFLVLTFIGLKNNNILELVPYLSGLGFGVLGGYFIGKSIFIK